MLFENLFPAGATQQHNAELFDQMLKYRYKEYRMCLYKQNIMTTYGFEWNGLTSSQGLNERDVHVMGVEEAAYKVRYRPVQAYCAMAKLVVSTFLACLCSLYL